MTLAKPSIRVAHDVARALCSDHLYVRKPGHDDFVWVVATYECIADLDSSQIADQFNATDIAEGHRERLEEAASAKFDERGIDTEEGVHEGMLVLRMHSYDLPG